MPGIFAAGDICEYDSPIHGGPMHIEHWDVAFNQGEAGTLGMLGRGVERDVVPYFFSDLANSVLIGVCTARATRSYAGEWRSASSRSSTWTTELCEGRPSTMAPSDDLEHAHRFLSEKTYVDHDRAGGPFAYLGSL